ncbi:MAG TPA: AraC family transcriptional regulator [Treponema sp.]|nr:AraC family transcriptional regulator [Treponema sp.]
MSQIKISTTSQYNITNLPAIQKLISVYAQTTGSGVRVYDYDCNPLSDIPGNAAIEEVICPHCPKLKKSKSAQLNEPCHEMHVSAIKESNRSGGKYLYACEAGLVFWISPMFNESRFSGALRGAGYICSDFLPENRETTEQFLECLQKIPRENWEKIKSLAEMMHFCAASLSPGNEDYHEIIQRRIDQQKNIAGKIDELKKQYPNNILPGYPMEKEQLLISALRKGDSKLALDLLNELLAVLFFSNSNHFRYIQLRSIELAVLLSRVDIDCGQKRNAALELNSLHIRQIKEAKTFEELTDTMHSMVKRICGVIASFQGIPHAAAMRKAECFIRENFTRKISLTEVAAISGLSAPYFSTIFKKEMGENLSKYLNRMRVEKASRMLLETDLALSEIAGACCFEDQSWFSKIFKSYTGTSPGKYRSQGGGMIQEISENNLSTDYLNKAFTPQ